MDAKYIADTKVADSKRQYQMQKAAFDMEVNAKVRAVFSSHNQALGILQNSFIIFVRILISVLAGLGNA